MAQKKIILIYLLNLNHKNFRLRSMMIWNHALLLRSIFTYYLLNRNNLLALKETTSNSPRSTTEIYLCHIYMITIT